MTTVDDKFMIEELDYVAKMENSNVFYEDYYKKICSYVKQKNAFRLNRDNIEFMLKNGYSDKGTNYKCDIKDKDEREKEFKRAIGLQIIYDLGNGRNTMFNDSNGNYDICRETLDCLNNLSLIQPVRW